MKELEGRHHRGRKNAQIQNRFSMRQVLEIELIQFNHTYMTINVPFTINSLDMIYSPIKYTKTEHLVTWSCDLRQIQD